LLARPAQALGVNERVLPNGPRVLVMPVRSAPIVVCDLHYDVGAFDEPPGQTGLAHFLEHLLFKGTRRFPKGEIDRLVALASGYTNAETGDDSTHYWFVFPNDRWELALAIEADRMHGAVFQGGDVAFERQVISEERARDLSTAWGRLEQKHSLCSYPRHPYRNPILGWPDDMSRINTSDLQAFYRAHYRPERAVLVVVGDVDPEAVFERARFHFGSMSSSADRLLDRPRVVMEPEQTARRDFLLISEEMAPRGLMGWHTVPRGHAHSAALDVTSDLLASGRQSRLWQALVETDRSATWVDAFHGSSRRAGQFLIQLEAVPGVDPASIERRVFDELTRLAADGPNRAELERSARRLDAAWRWEHEDLVSLAASIGSAALAGDWRQWQREHQAALKVTAADVRRVASRYFPERRLTAGWSLPYLRATSAGVPFVSERPPDFDEAKRRTTASIRIAEPISPTMPPRVCDQPDAKWARPAAVSRLKEYSPGRYVLQNGMRLLYEQRSASGLIALELHTDSGSVRELSPGVAHLTGRLREEGTTTRTASAIAEAIESAGGAFETRSTGVSLRARAEDLGLAMEIIADLAIRPAFPADALTWVKERIISEVRADLEDPAFLADAVFHSLVYGNHPLGRDVRATELEIERIDRKDVMRHHQRFVNPATSILVAVGDFEPERLITLVNEWFGAWRGGGHAARPLRRVSRSIAPEIRRIETAGEQVQIVLGHLGVHRRHPDFDRLMILDYILGSGPGFTDRLGRTLREELGLVYSVSGGMTDSADLLPGVFRVSAATSPEAVERVVRVIGEVIEEVSRGAFSDDEVEQARGYLAGSWVFDYQGIEQRAERLLDLERFGLSLDEPRIWPDRIDRIRPAQLRRAARLHLRPNHLTRVEVGPARPAPRRSGRSG
jgi:zinc protease